MEILLQTVLSTIEMAVFQNSQLVSKLQSPSLQKSNNTVVYDLQKWLQNIGLPFSHIHRFWVVNGPGYYTGIRIGLAIAKAFSDTTTIPIRLVTTFHWLRLGIPSSMERCCIFIPSSKKEGYLAYMHQFSVESVQCIEKEQMGTKVENGTLQEPLFVPCDIPDLPLSYTKVGDISTLPFVYKEVFVSNDIEPEYIKSVDDLFHQKKEGH